MKKLRIWLIVCFFSICSLSLSLESGTYRLLSVSDSEKIILVSHAPGKKKYLLDASSAKITINGKAAEFRELKAFSVLQLKMVLKKFSKNGIGMDGSATEIRITNTDKVK